MKIKIGEKVYLQKYEISYILYETDGFPGSLLEEIFDDDEIFFVNGSEDGFRFECVFENPKNVEWLMAQDWIVDYNEYAKTPIRELKELVKQLKKEYSTMIDEFNAQNIDYRKRYYQEVGYEFSKIRHRIASLHNIIAERKGKATFVFPEQ